MRIRVSQKFSLFKNASAAYKNESRRAKNSYFNSLKSVWSNPDIPARKKFSLLQKLTNSTKKQCDSTTI